MILFAKALNAKFLIKQSFSQSPKPSDALRALLHQVDRMNVSAPAPIDETQDSPLCFSIHSVEKDWKEKREKTELNREGDV